MNAFIILLNVTVIVIIIYYYWIFNYWKKRGVHTLKHNALFGNLSDVILRKVPTYRVLKELYATCKTRGDKFMGFYFFHKPTLVIVDPELIKTILVKDFSNFTDRAFYYNEKDTLGVHIISAKGSQWKKMRDQLTPAFSPSKLKNLCPILLQVGDQLKIVLDKSVKNSEVVDLNDVSSKFVADAIGMSIFGIESNTLHNSNIEFRNNAKKIFGGSLAQDIKMIFTILCPLILRLFRIPLVDYDIYNYFLSLIKKTVEYREKNNIVRNDLMDSIIQLRNNIDIEKENNLDSPNIAESKKLLNIKEITAQAIMFYGAAYESSAAAIALCMYELAVNEDIQATLRQEIVNTLENHKGRISYDVIMTMTYLDKCVLETLRKYPLIMMARLCSERYEVPNSNVVWDAGDTLYIPIYEIHYDPEYYPEPEKFDPERFSPENKLKRPSYTFLSLGEGQRNCIGARLAMLEIKIFLIIFLTNYNFTINSKTELPPPINNNKAALCFEKPIYLNVEKK